MKKAQQTETIPEPPRSTRLGGEYDIIICGGGPAGIGAALAAGRTGAKTLLIETHGCLGGVWTAGLVAWVIDAKDKGGIMAEIARDLLNIGAAAPRVKGGKSFAVDVEKMKLLLEEKCLEAGIDVQIHTRVVEVFKNGRKLTHVITESKSGRQAWAGKVFIDASGDGDLCALSGCGFDVGHPDSGQTQPMSLSALVTGIHFNEVEPFVGGGMRQPRQNLLSEMERAGLSPSYTPPIMVRLHNELFMLTANHEYGVSATDATAITKATLRARREIHELVEGLRNLGGVWRNLRIVATSEQIGVREGRRIHGRYTVCLKDMIEGIRHEDSVCTVTSGLDVHPVQRVPGKDGKHGYINGEKQRTKTYDIPSRALMAKDVDGLMMAGRCISGDFFAHSSYRMTGNAVAMGEVCGIVGAQACQTNRYPHEIEWSKSTSKEKNS